MPRTKSGMRALRQAGRKQKQNALSKEKINSAEKALRKAIAKGDRAQAQALLAKLSKAYDKAAQRRVVSKQRASRKKSQAALLVNPPTSPEK